jgi:hypothetical protein
VCSSNPIHKSASHALLRLHLTLLLSLLLPHELGRVLRVRLTRQHGLQLRLGLLRLLRLVVRLMLSAVPHAVQELRQNEGCCLRTSLRSWLSPRWPSWL